MVSAKHPPLKSVSRLEPSPTRAFLDELVAALGEIDERAVERIVGLLADAHRAGRAVLIMGNGGSAATASHFACDLQAAARSGKRLRVSSLNDNVPVLTALANDLGYENVFSEQVASNVAAGDIVIVLTASGDSENVLRAVRAASDHGAVTVGILGFGGGRARALVDHALVLQSRKFGIVESAHSALEHLITDGFRRRIAHP
ncbi:MAG: SIS domain-containing protein [Sorangiineae bacterium]|nr:SIS domain-containing protein [Polyangiaceae bacterium]MEB2321836.1 SIS domain-containing protein [Sorangiineae bacterium]